MRPGSTAALLVALTLAAAGCGVGGGPGGEGWIDDWRAEADASRQSRPGDTWVLARREPAPSGAVESRESWRMVEAREDHGVFRVERVGRAPVTQWKPLHPPVPTTRSTRGGKWVEGVRLATVRVPAGRYRCARTSRSYVENRGRVMQVDEWWAANVPVPVQRWTRWNAHATGPLRDPPRRLADQPMGTSWEVLERAPAREGARP